MKVIALTGHRPERLGLPDSVINSAWLPIRDWIRNVLLDEIEKSKEIEVFSGMASGSDIAMAIVACHLKHQGYPIKLTCICPFKGYGRKDRFYKYIMENSDNVINIHESWARGCDNDRDEYMAKYCDVMLAIFDGHENGGVYSTIKKAEKYHKKILYCPKNLLNTNAYKPELR